MRGAGRSRSGGRRPAVGRGVRGRDNLSDSMISAILLLLLQRMLCTGEQADERAGEQKQNDSKPTKDFFKVGQTASWVCKGGEERIVSALGIEQRRSLCGSVHSSRSFDSPSSVEARGFDMTMWMTSGLGQIRSKLDHRMGVEVMKCTGGKWGCMCSMTRVGFGRRFDATVLEYRHPTRWRSSTRRISAQWRRPTHG